MDSRDVVLEQQIANPIDFFTKMRQADVVQYVAFMKSVPKDSVIVGQKSTDGRTVFSARGRFPDLFRHHDHKDLDDWVSKRSLAFYRVDDQNVSFSFLNVEDEVFFAILMSDHLILYKETFDA